MLKISRNFCRFDCLLEYYSYYLKNELEEKQVIKKNFEGLDSILRLCINDSLSFYYFIDTILDAYKEDKFIKSLIINTNFKDFLNNENYKKCINKFNVSEDKNIEFTDELLETLKVYFNEFKDFKELIYKLSKDQNISNLLNVSPFFYSNPFFNIFKQINVFFNDEIFLDLLNIEELSKDSKEFCNTILSYLSEHEAQIRKDINDIAEKWSEKRIHIVEKIIMGLAISEYNVLKTPIQVTINEYVNLSKEFCGNKTNMFVNGLLDPLLKNQRNVGSSFSNGEAPIT